MNKSLLLVLLLGGCSFVPPYERPAAPVPATWPQLDPSGGTAPGKVGAGEAARGENWRTFFTAPELQRLIEAALAHNRDLHIAVARVEEARAQAGLARADRFPTIDAGLQEQAARVPGDLNATGRPAIARRFDANLGVAAFELDFWGRLKSLDAAAQATFLATDYARAAFRISLITDVANAWYSLVELDQRARLAEATVKTRAESRELVARRRDVGLATDLDYLTADGAYQSARADWANLVRQKVAAENALRLLVGADTGAVPSAPTFGPMPEIAVGLPSEVLLGRPDVLAAEQKLIAANANIGAARAAFFPRIALTVTAGSASAALSGLFSGGSGAWSFVPVLKWPLFDAGRNAANVDLAEARKLIAVAEYEKTIQQAFREVADLLAAREYYAAQLQALEQAETAQVERLRRVEARQRSGVSSYLELLDAQRDAYTAQQAVVAVRRAVAATAVGLFKATAGGI
ncbi:MAG: efflux transporter outer membrane subunit [Rhodocyclaceae bacterium]|jgi:multidrug efflux system outer membrane protein|nr:efflux transporter outer membrane subunit [Rhodocyclaceae bacterium]